MNQVQDSIKHVKGKHLNFAQRVIIQIRLQQDKWSPYRIAKELGCSANTVRNEIRRGTPELYWGKQKKYDALIAQSVYEGHRLNSHRTPSFLKVSNFLRTVELRFKDEKWSFDACVGYSRRNREFSRQEMVCTKTLYNYADRGLLGIKNIDLPQKTRRKRRKSVSPHKAAPRYGRCIDERPDIVNSREEFGHWEVDLVIGSKGQKDNVLMTLVERKTRYLMLFVLPDKSSAAVLRAFGRLKQTYKAAFPQIFRTITTDNGPEFSALPELENDSTLKIYYAHPYSSYEKGSNERHNGMIRRFIPKGKRIDSFTEDDIGNVARWCNTLPRKILCYNTPRALFKKELKKHSIPF